MPPRRKRRNDSDDEDCIVLDSLGSASGDSQSNGRRTQRKPHVSSPEPEPSKPKRHQIATACSHCREAKLKCSGRHPTCARCEARSQTCVYDVAEEGITRREDLRRRYRDQKEELERATFVLEYLKTGTDCEAAELLARLRLGDSVDQVYGLLDGDQDARFGTPNSPSVTRFGLPPALGLPQGEAGTGGVEHRASMIAPIESRMSIADLSPTNTSPASPNQSVSDTVMNEGHVPHETPSWPRYLDPALDGAPPPGSSSQQAHQSSTNPRYLSRMQNF